MQQNSQGNLQQTNIIFYQKHKRPLYFFLPSLIVFAKIHLYSGTYNYGSKELLRNYL